MRIMAMTPTGMGATAMATDRTTTTNRSIHP